MILVHFYANGKNEQLYIPRFKEGKIRLPEDIATQEIVVDTEKVGNQPNQGAQMKWTLSTSDKMKKDRCIQVDFHFTAGIDKKNHLYYNSINESKFIPNTAIGVLILKLYIVAFKHLKMFELEKVSESESCILTCVDHSNATKNFTPFFYQQTIETFHKRGITLDLLQKEVNKEYNLSQKEVFAEDKNRA